MMKLLFNIKNQDNYLLYLILVLFIITEVIDDLLDHILGSSILHSVLQLLIFIVLFFIITKIVLSYLKRKVNILIPDELRKILDIIKEAEHKGVIINLRTVGIQLNITKPTLKKRIDQLVYLKYVSFEKEGNNKYIKLTPLGNSIIK